MATQKVVGKAMLTNEHGVVVDETPILLEADEITSEGATLMLKFERALTVTTDAPILELSLFDGSIYRDTRSAPLKTPKGAK